MKKGAVSIEILAAVVILLFVVVFFVQMFMGREEVGKRGLPGLPTVSSPSITSGDECSTSADCSDGICMYKNGIKICGCYYDSDCNPNEKCIDNRCRSVSP